MQPKLKAILEVEKEQSVLCQQPGCAHSVYRAIHVIEEDGKVSVLGSTCFKKKFGRADALGSPLYGGGGGRRLTAAERQLLIDNTAALLEKLEQERIAQEQTQRDRLASIRADFVTRQQSQLNSGERKVQPKAQAPWEWVKPLSSVAHFPMKDGTSWVRVMHRDGFHMLMPWPWFAGWDKAFPGIVGIVDQELSGIKVAPADLVDAISYVKTSAKRMQFGILKDFFGGQK
jgi:hypothetical protein